MMTNTAYDNASNANIEKTYFGYSESECTDLCGSSWLSYSESEKEEEIRQIVQSIIEQSERETQEFIRHMEEHPEDEWDFYYSTKGFDPDKPLKEDWNLYCSSHNLPENTPYPADLEEYYAIPF